MKRYIYVEARDLGNEEDGTMVSFAHTYLQARDADDAYSRGPITLVQDIDMGRVEGHGGDGPFLNDYVIEVL